MTNSTAQMIKDLIAKRDLHAAMSAESNTIQSQIDALVDGISDELADEAQAMHASHAAAVERIG
jgi:hypothetical protein